MLPTRLFVLDVSPESARCWLLRSARAAEAARTAGPAALAAVTIAVERRPPAARAATWRERATLDTAERRSRRERPALAAFTALAAFGTFATLTAAEHRPARQVDPALGVDLDDPDHDLVAEADDFL